MTGHQRELVRAQCSGVLAEVDRALVAALSTLSGSPTTRDGSLRLLDVGCWDGSATLRYAASLAARPWGIEIFPEPGGLAAARGIGVVRLDLERDRFPWREGTFDVVVANQVFEHLKNIWLPLSEAFRVLRPGGYLVISVPNLASLHNRLLLLVGAQPTSIRVLGPHVRGFTIGSLIGLLALDGALEHCQTIGIGFYPFPLPLARLFGRMWPGGSHTMILVMRKFENRARSPWLPLSDQHGDVIAQAHYS